MQKVKAMRNTTASALGEQALGTISSGFVRDSEGRIIFLMEHGHWTFPFPVLEDGRISSHGAGPIRPTTIVTLVDPKELGISELRWANEEADFYAR